MLGIILWSDIEDRKAVIWCEDQGDLAYFQHHTEVLEQNDFFDAGDLVYFDIEANGGQRNARNPRLVAQKAATDLPDKLKKQRTRVENVVAFPAPRA